MGTDGESGILVRVGVEGLSTMPDVDKRLSTRGRGVGGALPFLFFFFWVDGAEMLGGRYPSSGMIEKPEDKD